MNNKLFFICLGSLLLSLCSACAQSRKAFSKPGAYARVLDGRYTRILQGRQESGIRKDYVVRIIWKSNTPPVTFFWKPDNEWLTCLVYNKYPATSERSIAPESVRRGDTLTLIPMRGGRDVMPAGIPAKAKNSLFFKTAKSSWMYLPVKLEQAPDQVMQ